MQTHSVHCAAGVKPVTTIHQTYHVVNFRQFYPIQQNPKFHEEQDWRMNQHAYQDVKILNINDRKHLANMHTQQPMNQFRSNEAIHQNPEIPNMKT